MSRVLLVRHGQSTWNAAGRWQGQADPPLSELGERQAETVAADLLGAEHRLPAGPAITRVWASPLVRARRTAEIIAAALGLDVEIDERLREVDAGEWTGLTRAEIEAQWPGYLAERRRPPRFEAPEHLEARAIAVVDQIAAPEADRRVLVVTHGGLVGAVERHLRSDWMLLPNLAGREVIRDHDGLALGERFLLLDPDAVEVTTPRQI